MEEIINENEIEEFKDIPLSIEQIYNSDSLKKITDVYLKSGKHLIRKLDIISGKIEWIDITDKYIDKSMLQKEIDELLSGEYKSKFKSGII